MQTRIQDVPVSALAGGLVAIGGVALWQLGMEFERAWLRSYHGPLEGETPAGVSIAALAADAGAAETLAPAAGRERRWVSAQRSRRVLRPRVS